LRPLRAVLFDLDGTLVDTAEEIALAVNLAFAGLRLPALPEMAVADFIGRGVRSMVERSLAKAGGDAGDLDAAVESFEAHYEKIVGTRAALFPGVLVGLRILHDAGFALGVVTNKPRYFTELLLSRLEVDSFFAGLVAGDDGVPKKPHGDMLEAACRQMGTLPDSTLMIGDSDNDVLAARAAGSPVWCVPYGYNEGRGAETLACDRLVATVEEAARLLTAPRG
jgi:phosphoglycolate phosphatase